MCLSKNVMKKTLRRKLRLFYKYKLLVIGDGRFNEIFPLRKKE